MPDLSIDVCLEGDGVVLRGWREEDAPALEPVCGEWNVCAFTSMPWAYSEVAAEAWVGRQRGRREDGTAMALAITTPGQALPVGNVNLGRFDAAGRGGEIGYWLVPDVRGRGLAAAAVRLLSRWGFQMLGLERIELAILPENLASRRVARSVGASAEGLRERSHEWCGRWFDMEIYALER